MPLTAKSETFGSEQLLFLLHPTANSYLLGNLVSQLVVSYLYSSFLLASSVVFVCAEPRNSLVERLQPIVLMLLMLNALKIVVLVIDLVLPVTQ